MKKHRTRTARSARGKGLLTLLGVLCLGSAVTWVAFAASTPPPAPTITSGPANPTSQTSATFTYTDSQPVTKFQCSLDGGAFVDCGTSRPSTKTYSGLSAGSHTFRVRAEDQAGNVDSTPASRSFKIVK
jgi:hypothetical protein